MDCAEEVGLIRRRLGCEQGICDLSFDVFQGKLTAEFDPDLIDPPKIRAAIAETGLSSEDWADQAAVESFWSRRGRDILVAASAVALLIGLTIEGLASGSILQTLLAHEHGSDGVHPESIAFFVAAMLCGAYFIVPKGLRSLRALRPEMNALVLVSILGSSFLGEWAEGATLAFLFALAGRLEGWSMNRARQEVRGLISVAPERANVLHHDHEHAMAPDRVPLGATVRVRPGERVPCDGLVRDGSSGVNEAMITGESIPVWKSAGDEVFAGTLNGDGTIEIETTKKASDSRLARILRMIEETQHRRAPAEQFVDRFARRYTPIMFLLAGAVFLVGPFVSDLGWSFWFYQSMLVLLISCPCALVISTPVTIVAAVASAAKRGILIKGGAYLEKAAHVQAAAFDKTGVLTLGEPRVTALRAVGGRSERDTLQALASLEHYSEHPLARAIVEFALEQGVEPEPVKEFRALQGEGATASFDGVDFWVGNSRLLEDRVDDPESIRPLLAEMEDSEHTVVVCGSGREAWALVGLRDPVRPAARGMLDELRALGLRRLVMLTGDNDRTAQAIAAKVGIDDVRSRLLPDDKQQAVKELIAEHGEVAMVGDGVNDAQAISAAGLGIGVGGHGRGADVALETADIVVLSSRISDLPFLIRHARRALGVIKQNVALALLFKAAFIALALTGQATLWMAVAADMGATLLVIFNGLRLLRAGRPPQPSGALEPLAGQA